jgi:hypothetical protein
MRGEIMLCKKTVKNQITLPKKIMERFKGITYFEVETKENKIILTPVRIKSDEESKLLNIRRKILSLGISEKDIDKAIEWARKK